MLWCPVSPLQRLIGCPDSDGTGATCLDDARTALSLITTWSIQTGKTLPARPIEQLTARELENFWADDSMLDPPPGRSPAGARPAP